MGDIQDGTGWEVMERAYHIDRRNKIIEIFIAVLLFFVTHASPSINEEESSYIKGITKLSFLSINPRLFLMCTSASPSENQCAFSYLCGIIVSPFLLIKPT